MVNLDLKAVEKKLGFSLKRNYFSVGFDTASATGIAILETTSTKLIIKTDIFKLPKVEDTEDKSDMYEQKLDVCLQFVREFKKKLNLKEDGILVLENSYMGFNPATYGFLKGLMGLIYATLYDYFPEIKIIFPTAARKMVGFKSELPKKSKREQKKEELVKWVNERFDMEEENDNITDAIILAVCGLKKGVKA
jgi:hypothetical protein